MRTDFVCQIEDVIDIHRLLFGEDAQLAHVKSPRLKSEGLNHLPPHVPVTMYVTVVGCVNVACGLSAAPLSAGADFS